MAWKYSVAARNNRLNSLESEIGTSPLLRICTLAPPANCAAAAVGAVLAEMTLPSDWMAAAASGSKAKSGTWSDPSANTTGTAGHFRIYNSAASVCHIQGTVGIAGSGADMIVDSTAFTATQTFTILTFTLTDGNS